MALVLKPEQLTREAFREFGDYEILLELPETRSRGSVDSGFFPDAIQIENGGKSASFSITRVSGKSSVIKSIEYHSATYEGILPLDNDIYIFAGPAYWYLKTDEIRLFKVPKCTLVKLKPGTLHGSPISADGKPANVLIILPERTYSNDCKFIDLEEKDYINIEW